MARQYRIEALEDVFSPLAGGRGRGAWTLGGVELQAMTASRRGRMGTLLRRRRAY